MFKGLAIFNWLCRIYISVTITNISPRLDVNGRLTLTLLSQWTVSAGRVGSCTRLKMIDAKARSNRRRWNESGADVQRTPGSITYLVSYSLVFQLLPPSCRPTAQLELHALLTLTTLLSNGVQWCCVVNAYYVHPLFRHIEKHHLCRVHNDFGFFN